MTLGARIGIGVVGALLLFFGWAARSLEQETSSLGLIVMTSPDGTIGAYQPPDLGLEGPLEIQDVDDGTFAVVAGDQVFFTGSETGAEFWFETRGAEPLFTGTRAEVEAWVDEQEAAEDAENMFWPMALMVAGGVTLLAAVALGRD